MDFLDKHERAAYIAWLHERGGRGPKPQPVHGWTAEQTWSGEAWPTDPLLRAAIVAASRAEVSS